MSRSLVLHVSEISVTGLVIFKKVGSVKNAGDIGDLIPKTTSLRLF